METREYEPFKVFHTNTKRQQESPKIYMQNQLKNEVKRKKDLDRLWKN